MNRLFTCLALLLLVFGSYNSSFAQANVLNPADPDVIFTASNQPAPPAYNNYNIVKWGHTSRLSWNPYSYGYRSYIYQGMAFRLKFPKTYAHNVVDGKKYPLFIFFHGMGEAGTIYDNEYQLLHGGQLHAEKVNNGTFDGFLFYAQSTNGASQDYLSRISSLIDSLTKHVKVDIDRVVVSGLSAGGGAAWDILANNTYNKKIAASLPISAAATGMVQHFPNYITVPLWVCNGGLDPSPAPYTVDYLITNFRNLGGKLDQTFFPDQGHGVWGSFWNTNGYWPYLNAQHKANPLVYFQRQEFCPGVTVNAKLGLHPGFNAYQWEKDGTVIAGATGNILNVSSYGTYKGRFRRTATSAWSEWSPTPVIVSQKQGTVTPPIETKGMFSNVLPSLDGRTTVPLTVPGTFSAFEWRRVSDDAIVSTTRDYNAPIGQYKLKVTEQYGCSSVFSDPYKVVAANGTNPPDNISNFAAATLSSSSVRLDWNDNPTPVNNETAFEIYRSNSPGSGYVLIAKKEANVLSHIDDLLQSNRTYYYKIRAVNSTGAAPVSNEVNATTSNDLVAPTAPANLVLKSTSRTSLSLSWDAATDDVGVFKYDVYINNIKRYTTSNTSITASALAPFQTFFLYVIARDLAGNESPKSNQVTGSTVSQGLNYKYYQGAWTVLPNFSSLTPLKTGHTPNIDLTVRNQNDNFGFLWEGTIEIPVTGSYTFETISDDGSKLYIGPYSHTSTALVNNDGLHGNQSRSGTIALTAGTYPIAIVFFDQGGGEVMEVYWQSAAAGIARQRIPSSAFTDAITLPPGSVPLKPSDLLVTGNSYKRINLSWVDNSNNEAGFEVTRATALLGSYVNIATTAANVTSYADSVGLSANTKYWYKVRAINQLGQSEAVSVLVAKWNLDNNYDDGSGNNRNLTGNATPVFNAADKKEGTHSISLNGSSQYLNLPFGTSGLFPSDAYNTRSIAVWIKPNAAAISGANKIIYDFGGADNGMSLRFNSGSLQAGIASGNNRFTAVLNSVTSNIHWVANGWNHVSVVYNVNNIALYLNGVLKATTNLNFSSVNTSTNASRIGATNSSNAFNSSTSSTNYGGLIDDITIVKEPLSPATISALMTQSYTADTTSLPPASPAEPSNLTSPIQTAGSISLNFSDNSTNESSFEIHRSANSNNNFRLQATLPASSASLMAYTDSNLYANTNYYYKVRATGIGGTSQFTPELVVKTGTNLPEFTSLSSFSMRYSSQKTVAVSASDADGETLVFSFLTNLPAFASFANISNGVASLVFNPTPEQIGVYPISILVTDASEGKDTLNFVVTVNNNYVPVIVAVNNHTVAEGSTTNIAISATDADGNAGLTWSATNAPGFVTLTDNGNGTGNLLLAPGYVHAGTYPVTLTSLDVSGASENITFTVTVTNVEPSTEKVYMNVKYTHADAPAPWNNLIGTNTNNLLNSNGQVTPIGIEFLGTPWNLGNAGGVTGNNSGVYPDAVMRDYFYFGVYGAPETVNVNLKGLDVTGKYNVTLYGNSAWTGLGNNGTTVYSINGVQKPLYVDNNTQNTVTFTSVVPSASGIITVNMSKAAGTPYGLLTSVVLEKPFNDGTTPILPTNLTATALPNGTVKLSWTDLAYNEDQYLVFRALNAAGPYQQLNAGASNANDSTYIDNTVQSSTTYYYKIKPKNSNGASGETNVVSVVTGNKAPVLSAVNDLFVKTGNNQAINFTASDDLGNVLTATVTGLPSFASFNNAGNGNGTINFNPSQNDLGIYNNIIVKVTDNFGASVADTFKVSVVDSDIRSVFINFGMPGGTAQSAPWNNHLTFPYANVPLSNLKDDANANTNFSIRLQQQWDGTLSYGMITGENSGIFPDNVMKPGIYTSSTAARGIQIDGLNPAKRYNVVFFSSHNAGSSSLVTYTSGSQTVTQESRYNDKATVQLNGLAPNASGTLVVTATKNSSAAFLNLNAMIIEEFNVGGPLIRPLYLMAESLLDSGKVKLTWADRSTNETGFQIYRSTTPAGPYTLVTTTAANVTTYTNSGLNANQRYFYKVSATNASGNSNYSNIASLVLPAQIVFVNFNVNVAQNAPSPWNNTNNPPTAGAVFSNLANNLQGNSGIEMSITESFSGPGFAGTTGAGIFPSVVMESNFWNDGGQLSQLKFNNLEIGKKYRIGFFGSAIFTGGYSIANYTCNGKTVQLNSLHNNSKIVYLTDLVPVEGELVINVTTAAGSPYCFTGAVTIESYDDVTPYSPITISGERQIVTPGDDGSGSSIVGKNNNTTIPAATAVATTDFSGSKPTAENSYSPGINVYPNPFTSRIDVELTNEKASQVTVLLYDLNSRLVYKTADLKQAAGHNKITVNLPSGSSLLPGSYVVSIMVNGKQAKAVKLIKVN